MKATPRRAVDAALSIVTVGLLITLFFLAGGRNAVLQAWTTGPVTLDGEFSEWADAAYWDDPKIHGRNYGVPDEAELAPDQKEIQFVEDIQRAWLIDNNDGFWFRLDRWWDKPNSPGIKQPVYYCVYFDLGMNHEHPHYVLPGEKDWYGRFRDFDDPDPVLPVTPGDAIKDYILFCAFNPDPDRTKGEVMARLYLAEAAPVIPDPTAPANQGNTFPASALVWPGPATPVAEYIGDWGEPFDTTTKEGGLSVEYGLPSYVLTDIMGLQPGDAFQIFFGATLNDPLNKGFYPQQDFAPNEYDIARYDVPALGVVGTALLFAMVAGIALSSLRRNLLLAQNGTGRP